MQLKIPDTKELFITATRGNILKERETLNANVHYGNLCEIKNEWYFRGSGETGAAIFIEILPRKQQKLK